MPALIAPRSSTGAGSRSSRFTPACSSRRSPGAARAQCLCARQGDRRTAQSHHRDRSRRAHDHRRHGAAAWALLRHVAGILARPADGLRSGSGAPFDRQPYRTGGGAPGRLTGARPDRAPCYRPDPPGMLMIPSADRPQAGVDMLRETPSGADTSYAGTGALVIKPPPSCAVPKRSAFKRAS